MFVQKTQYTYRSREYSSSQASFIKSTDKNKQLFKLRYMETFSEFYVAFLAITINLYVPAAFFHRKHLLCSSRFSWYWTY